MKLSVTFLSLAILGLNLFAQAAPLYNLRGDPKPSSGRSRNAANGGTDLSTSGADVASGSPTPETFPGGPLANDPRRSASLSPSGSSVSHPARPLRAVTVPAPKSHPRILPPKIPPPITPPAPGPLPQFRTGHFTASSLSPSIIQGLAGKYDFSQKEEIYEPVPDKSPTLPTVPTEEWR